MMARFEANTAIVHKIEIQKLNIKNKELIKQLDKHSKENQKLISQIQKHQNEIKTL